MVVANDHPVVVSWNFLTREAIFRELPRLGDFISALRYWLNKMIEGRLKTTVVILLAVSCMALTSCQRERPERITLSDVEDRTSITSDELAHQVFRVAVAPVLSPRTTLDTYQNLIAYIGKALDKTTVLIQGKTYGEVNALLQSGDVSAAIVCSGAFVAGQDEFGMEALAAPQIRGETVYYSYLIVRQNSTARSLRDLKGQSFAIQFWSFGALI
jgi:ABC-type phosphate/phosphonate transport system substrate-binding protein